MSVQTYDKKLADFTFISEKWNLSFITFVVCPTQVAEAGHRVSLVHSHSFIH